MNTSNFYTSITSDLDTNKSNCFLVDDASECSQLFKCYNNSEMLRIITANIRSINCNFDLLVAFISGLSIDCDIIVLTECWLRKDTRPPNLDNYSVYYTQKILNQNDGVVVYVRKNLSTICYEPDITDGNCLVLNIDNKYSIICSYRPPCYVNPRQYLLSLDAILSKISGNQIIFTGDININTLNTDIGNNFLDEYLCIMASHGLEQGITHPTRLGNCLDHFMIKTYNEWKTFVFPPLTDHCPILLEIKNSGICKTTSKTVKQVLDYESAISKIRDFDWSYYFTLQDINQCTEYLVSTIKSIIKDCTRVKHSSKKIAPLKPWITTGVVRSIRKRNKLHKLAKLKPDDDLAKIAFINYRNTCNKLIKSLKRQYYQTQLQNSNKDIKKTWTLIKEICNIKTKHDTPTELLSVESTPKQSLNKINTYFTNIGKNLAEVTLQKLNLSEDELARYASVHTKSNAYSMSLSPTDPYEVSKIITDLKPDSSPGHDGISSKIIKLAKEHLIYPLVHLCNLSLEQAKFPDLFKTAIVTPIFKTDNKLDISNYRPISLLNILSKILERIVNSRLINYLEKNKLLTDYQYGFRKGRSTDDAVLDLTSLIHKYVDRGEKVIGVFLDLKKAFDTVSAPILLSKLEALGVRGHAYQWFQSYLDCREQYVKVNNYLSDPLRCNFGIPQGSTLGPTLFLVYINSLPDVLPSNADPLLFADDTVLLFHGQEWKEVHERAESCLKYVTTWLEDNLLTLNVTKTKYLCFAKSSNPFPSQDLNITLHTFPCNRTPANQCDCNTLTRARSIRYLGVLVDDNLSWKEQTDNVCTRVRRLIYIFKQLRTVASQKILIQTYKALCQSVIYYCVTAWGSAPKSRMIHLERTQRTVLKVLLRLPYQHPTTALYEDTQLLSVRRLFVLQCLLRYHRKSAQPLIQSKKRKLRCPLPISKSTFAQRHYNFIAPYLYNQILDQTNTNIAKLNSYKFKKYLIQWLLKLNYEQTENLLVIPK